MFQIFRIEGQSMYPAFKHGDIVLTRTAPKINSCLKLGDDIVFDDPKHGVLLKRITGIDIKKKKVKTAGLHVDSLCSSHYGLTPMSRVIGKVIFRISFSFFAEKIS